MSAPKEKRPSTAEYLHGLKAFTEGLLFFLYLAIRVKFQSKPLPREKWYQADDIEPSKPKPSDFNKTVQN